jgi:ethanolamine utilization protein EutA
MHDLEFEHLHVTADDTREINEAAWLADNVELTTVGIDIGSSTSHLMFARVHLQRLASALSSRFVVVDRRVLWQSPILLTSYLQDYTIDTAKLAKFIARAYADAGLKRGDVDSGAVILTGEALKRKNARAIADLFSEEAGKFVCASAGHHMECQMAAHGSGAVALSKSRGVTVLNVDIGGGTTKFALVLRGQVLATAATAVGGRLIVEDPGTGIMRLEPPAEEIARDIGLDLKLGGMLSHQDRHHLADRMTDIIVAMARPEPPDALAAKLLFT